MSRVLSILLCLYNIQLLDAGTCPGNQITWVSKNNTFVRCSPCPPCPPGQEFTIACHTKVLEGTLARCINCPRGKYSRSFDTKPCVHCETCSKRYIKRACSSLWNAECGDCLPGYYKSDVVFDCIECDKCCGDGKDSAPPGCKKVGMCKPRSQGCPKDLSKLTTKRPTEWIPRTSSTNKISRTSSTRIAPTFNHQTTKAKVQPLTKRRPSSRTATKIRLKLTPTPPNGHLNGASRVTTDNVHVENYKQVEEKDLRNYYIYEIATYILAVVVLALAFSLGYFVRFKSRERRTDGTDSPPNRAFSRSLSNCSTSNDVELIPSASDMTLKEFEENAPDHFEEVCIQLNQYRGGMYDFDRIGYRLSLTQTQRQALLNNANQNPTKDLIGIQNSSFPGFTVKQFAKVVKDIKRKDVYEKLQPFFERNTMEFSRGSSN